MSRRIQNGTICSVSWLWAEEIVFKAARLISSVIEQMNGHLPSLNGSAVVKAIVLQYFVIFCQDWLNFSKINAQLLSFTQQAWFHPVFQVHGCAPYPWRWNPAQNPPVNTTSTS